MMIWVNGAFGAGKTTLADELHRRLPEALAFDPEYVGYILGKWVPSPESGDFQDIPLWRKLVADCAGFLAGKPGRSGAEAPRSASKGRARRTGPPPR